MAELLVLALCVGRSSAFHHTSMCLGTFFTANEDDEAHRGMVAEDRLREEPHYLGEFISLGSLCSMFENQVLDFVRLQKVFWFLRINMKCLSDAIMRTITGPGDQVWMCWHQEASPEAEVRAMLRMCEGTGSGSRDCI